MEETDNLPPLSHLQFAVLDVIGTSAMKGKELRSALREQRRVFKTGPGFYQMMSRLEDAGWVAGEYRQEKVNGHAIKERFYIMTEGGQRAVQETALFYANAATKSTLGAVAV